MQLPAALQAHLHALSQALQDPDENLTAAVRTVLATWREAVPSLIGLALIVTVDGHPTTISTLDEDRSPPVGSSVRLPLLAENHRTDSPDIVFYASAPGAFVDFSADAAHILGLPLDTILLDQDLTPEFSSNPSEDSTIHQATGVLIDRGHTPEAALPALHALATATGTTLLAAAQLLLRSPT